MQKIALISVLLIAVSGCATEPVPTSAATPIPANRIFKAGLTKPEPGTGSLIVKRDTGLNSSACTFRLYINGDAFADIDPGEKVQINLKPGEHIVGMAAKGGLCLNGNVEAAFNLAAGQTKTYRVSVGSASDLKLQPTAF